MPRTSPPVPFFYLLRAAVAFAATAFLTLSTALAATFTVTTNSDIVSGTDGVLSLREAIIAANGAAGPDTIAFAIPGAGVRTIAPASALPTITDPVFIDGYSQPGTSPNTLVAADNAVLRIEINGAGTSSGSNGLTFAGSGGGSTVRGLVINRFPASAIYLDASSNNTFTGNFIGTDPTGFIGRGNGSGIATQFFFGSTNVVIGGIVPAARNLISGNNGTGIELNGGGNARVQGNLVGLAADGVAVLSNTGNGIAAGSFTGGTLIGGDDAADGTTDGVVRARNFCAGNGQAGIFLGGSGFGGATVQGNYIGTDVSGTQARPNGAGISTNIADSAIVGGASPGAGNLISGNATHGIGIGNTGGMVIKGNRIGTAGDGVTPLGNGTEGINFLANPTNNRIGGVAVGEGNVIAYNGRDGVEIFQGTGNPIRGNSIHSNGTMALHLGIDLEVDGVTANDAGDSDSGANGQQNFPVITSVYNSGGATVISGTLNSAANANFALDFYSSASANASGYGEGQTFLGTTSVATDNVGTGSFTFTPATGVPAGKVVTATATDSGNNTSEFSAVQTATVAPPAINSAEITNYTGFIIPSDINDGDPTTNRQRIHTDGSITFNGTGDFRLDWALIDPADAVAASDTETVLGASGTQIFHAQIIPSSATPLVPGRAYRLRLNVVDLASGSIVATLVKPSRTYIHFTGTVSNSPDVNIVGEITAVTVNRDWLLETDPTKQKIPVKVDYTFYRYDDWAGASTSVNALGNLVPVIRRESDGVFLPCTVEDGGFASVLLPSYVAGSPKTPASVSGSRTILVDPADILSPADYRIQVTLEHIEEPARLAEVPPVFISRTDNSQASAAAAISHFTGRLLFGDISTHFTHLAGAPTINVPNVPLPGANWRHIAPDAQSGTIDGRSDYHYGDGTVLNVNLAANGDASFSLDPEHGAQVYSVALVADNNAALAGAVNGVDFERSGDVTLKPTGAFGTVLAMLPPGVGWTAHRATNLLESELEFADLQLDQSLAPAGATAVRTFAVGDFFLCEETKPVFIRTGSFTWDIATGEFQCGTATAHSIRQPLLEYLASYAADYPEPSMATKRSNDHLYNFVTTATEMRVSTGLSGGGEMSGTFASGPGEFVTHYPYDSKVKWTGSATIGLARDLIDPETSSFTNVDPLLLIYAQHCQELVEGGCGGEKFSSVTLTPESGVLHFTSDGGLQAAGVTTVQGLLAWGFNLETAGFAHLVTTNFPTGNFLMAGTFLRGDKNALADEDGASVLLLSGFDPNELSTAERPLTNQYKVGHADYAGVNFRTADGSYSGQSNLQGTPYGAYPLTTRSKYYARRSGVSGIHEATPGGFPGTATLAGYPFHFTKFGLTFLSNEQEDSRTAGDIDLPAPTDFTLPFTDLRLSGVGALESVSVTGAGAVDSKTFAFWNAPFTPFTCDFLSTDGCNPAAGTTLVLGFSAHASHFDTAFAGSLGIKPDGHFARAADAVAGLVAAEVPTRLTLPASLAITGTEGESYTFFPAQGAYLNDATSGAGFWSLFGKLDVPFFEDMAVQVHASATPDDTLSPLYFMGGWPTQGWTQTVPSPAGSVELSPFDFVLFDGTHLGKPGSVTLDAYRKTIDDGTDLYLPRAQKLWLGVLDFDYPLKWSSTTFNFLSRGPVQSNLLGLLDTQHELLFLDARYAEITFGVRYDGLPEISLSNFVFNAVDDATGVASALISAAGDKVFGALENGVAEFGNTLSDEADKLLGRAVEAAFSVPVDGAIAVVKDEMADGVWTAAEINDALTAYLADASHQISAGFTNLGAAYANPKSLVFDLDQRLAKIERGVDSVINTVTLDPVTGLVNSSGEWAAEKGEPGRRRSSSRRL